MIRKEDQEEDGQEEEEGEKKEEGYVNSEGGGVGVQEAEWVEWAAWMGREA